MDFVGVMHQAVEDGVSDRGIADAFMPMINGKLSSHDGGGAAVPVFDDLQDLSSLWSGHRGQTEIIDHQDFSLEQFFHELWVRAVCSGDSEFLEQARQPDVVGLEAHPAGSVCKSAGEIGFTHSSGTGDDDVLVIGNPFALSQVEDDGLIETAWSFEVDVFGTGTDFESGDLEETLQASVLLPSPLTIDDEGDSFLEGQILGVRLLDQLFERIGHAIELHGVEFV